MLVSAPVFRCLACFFALFLVVSAPYAQTATPTPTPKNAPLQMTLSSPFSYTATPLVLLARRGVWFPVAVTLSNTGDAVTGTLRLRLRAGGEFENAPNESYCPVDLPTNARKTVWLYGRLERPNVAAVEISLEGRGFQPVIQRVAVQEPEANQRLILTISDGDSGLADSLKSLRGRGLSLSGAPTPLGLGPNASQAPLRALETGRIGVPDRWFGLENADLVVLGDFPHTALLPPQIEALRGFVAGGGTLMALGGSNAARLRGSPLADLWPAQIGNSSTASAGEVAGIVSEYVENPRNGADRLGGAPVVVTRATLRSDAGLRVGTRAEPLFSYRDEGAGRVLLLGFDPSQPPFNGWSGQSGLWREVFGTSVRTRRIDNVDGDFVPVGTTSGPGNFPGGFSGGFNPDSGPPSSTTPTGQLLAVIAKAPQLRMPPVSQIAWFLSLYVFVLVPLNYAVLRVLDRRELAWVTIPVIVALFSAFAYAAALSIRGSAILTRQVDVVQSSIGSKVARTDSLLWLFSPKRTSYDISSSSANAAVADYSNEPGAKQGAFSILQPADASSFKVESANVWMWTDRAFSAQSLVDLKGGISLNGNSIQNGTPFTLRGAVWVQDRAVRRLGEIKSGQSAPIPTGPNAKVSSVELMGAIQQASGLGQIFDTATVSNGIPQSALSAALGEGFGRQNTGTFLVAWGKTPVAPLSVGRGGARSSDLALMIFRVPKSPKVLAAREATVTLAGYEPKTAALTEAAGGGVNFYQCQLPDAKDCVLKVRGVGASAIPQIPAAKPGAAPIARGALPVWMYIEAWNAQKKRWVALEGNLKRDNSSTGGWDFSARVASDYARQSDRLLHLRVRLGNDLARVSSVRLEAEPANF
ncbi:MAG TPA: hypothetical protein VGB45_09885 [Abditibacterium sp.]|jgi:hypothetical protein